MNRDRFYYPPLNGISEFLFQKVDNKNGEKLVDMFQSTISSIACIGELPAGQVPL